MVYAPRRERSEHLLRNAHYGLLRPAPGRGGSSPPLLTVDSCLIVRLFWLFFSRYSSFSSDCA